MAASSTAPVMPETRASKPSLAAHKSQTGARVRDRRACPRFAVLGLTAGGAGVRLLFLDQQDARQSLARLVDPIDKNPVMAAFRRRDVELAHHRIEVDGRELRRLLTARADQRLPASLVVTGLILGFTGTLLTLP